MVTKEKYNSIRNKRTFLYEYFIAAGGKFIEEHQFSVLFGVWLGRMGRDNQTSIGEIVNFLDKKFGKV